MKKNVIVFGIVLLFLGLTITPTINSSFVNINSEEDEQNEDEEYVEVEIYDFKGYYGFEKTVKKLTIDECENLQNDLDSIQIDDLSLETAVKQKIKIVKKYNLIHENYTFDEMQRIFNKQKNFNYKMAFGGIIGTKLNQTLKNDISNTLYNLLSLITFNIRGVDGLTFGLPPFRLIWPWIIPYIPTPSAWATAWFYGYVQLSSAGLMGIKSTHETFENHNSLILLGFVGISLLIIEPGTYPLEFIPTALGFGYAGFCITYLKR